MKIPKDWREFIGLLNSRGVDFLIVGAHALAHHAVPRATGDLDIFFRGSQENARAVAEVLQQFGFASAGVTAADLELPDQIVQLGFPPNRIDLIASISGVSFEEAWASRVPGELDGLSVQFIGRETLIKNKLASGRKKDLSDLEALEAG